MKTHVNEVNETSSSAALHPVQYRRRARSRAKSRMPLSFCHAGRQHKACSDWAACLDSVATRSPVVAFSSRYSECRSMDFGLGGLWCPGFESELQEAVMMSHGPDANDSFDTNTHTDT